MIRVIVADDLRLVRDGVRRALDSDPAIEVVGQAENGIDALRLAEKLEPDIMILDMRTPDFSEWAHEGRFRGLTSRRVL